MASVTGGKRSDAKHMCDCGIHTLYHCRMLGHRVSVCVHGKKREKKWAAFLNTTSTPTKEQLEIAYSEGHQAYHDGYTLTDNPYSVRSKQADEWRSGWKDERSDDPYWEQKGIRNLTF